MAAGQVLAILEGHDAARMQVGMAEARKKQVNHERMLKKKRLALERELRKLQRREERRDVGLHRHDVAVGHDVVGEESFPHANGGGLAQIAPAAQIR